MKFLGENSSLTVPTTADCLQITECNLLSQIFWRQLTPPKWCWTLQNYSFRTQWLGTALRYSWSVLRHSYRKQVVHSYIYCSVKLLTRKENTSDSLRVYHLIFPTVQIHIVKLMDDSLPDTMHSEKRILSEFCYMGNGEL